jgi:hypothetical protein
MDIRRSPASSRNDRVRSVPGRPGAGNRAWLAARAKPGDVVFVGGAGLADFRVRVAQSALRYDLLPGFWSMVGLAESATSMLTVPLGIGDEPSIVPAVNGVRRVKFAALDDPARYPNMAVIAFAESAAAIVSNVSKLKGQRSAVDLPSAILPWLGFVWGAAGQGTPLTAQVGLPGAALVETAFGMSGIELTPGLASGSSCPEAIWQSALWWHDYYRETASEAGARVATDREQVPAGTVAAPRPIVPKGDYWVRQEAAAVTFDASVTPSTRGRGGRGARSTSR